jgi:hypothetical protein
MRISNHNNYLHNLAHSIVGNQRPIIILSIGVSFKTDPKACNDFILYDLQFKISLL